ncbi:MAG: hypothetical protein ACRC9X_00450, partial [Bacteroidales bacterium]
FTTLDLSKCTKISSLDIADNTNLTTLNLSNNTALSSFSQSGLSRLTTLNMTNCTALSSIRLSNLSALEDLTITNSQLSTFPAKADWQGMKYLKLHSNSSLNRTYGSSSGDFDFIGHPNLRTIEFKNSSQVARFLGYESRNLSTVDLTGATVTYIQVYLCAITSMKVPLERRLTYISARDNRLSTLELRGAFASSSSYEAYVGRHTSNGSSGIYVSLYLYNSYKSRWTGTMNGKPTNDRTNEYYSD